MVKDIVEDFQSLQCPMRDVSAKVDLTHAVESGSGSENCKHSYFQCTLNTIL